MKKIQSLVLCFASLGLLVGCGSTKPSTPSNNSSVNSSSSSTPVSSESKASSSAKSSSSSKASSSATSIGPIVGERDYKIFDSAPEIKFTTTADLSFATTPRRETEKPEVTGTFTTSNCKDEYKLDDVKGTMKVRGNYTSNYTKKPFRIKFETKQNLFGLNSGKKYKKWVLLADVKDSSMLRNLMTWYLARNIFGEDQWVSDCTPVHLTINNTYWGLYLLGEQKENKSGRIDAPEIPNDGDYDGTDIGYVMELDHYYNETTNTDPTFEVDYKPVAWNVKHSGENHPTPIEKGYTMGSDLSKNAAGEKAQLAFIKKRVEMSYQIMYNAVKNNVFQEIQNEEIVASSATTVEECLAKTINIDSFVNMYILNEIACDPDIGYSSFYLTFDNTAEGDKKLKLDNPWDWDSSLGVRAGTVENSQGMYASKSSNPWLAIMCSAKFFQDKVAAKWAQMKKDDLLNRSLKMIEEYAYQYAPDYKRNFTKWPGNIGYNREVDFEVRKETQNFKTEKQAEEFLYNWVKARYDYLDTVFPTGNLQAAQNSGGSTGGNTGGGSSQSTAYNDNDNTVKTAQKYRFEAENMTASGEITMNKTGYNTSGNKYVGSFAANSSLTFKVNAAAACNGYVYIGLAKTNLSHLSNWLTVSVNGTAIQPTSDKNVPSAASDQFHEFFAMPVGLTSFKAGVNEVVISIKQANCTNIDYVDIQAPQKLTQA